MACCRHYSTFGSQENIPNECVLQLLPTGCVFFRSAMPASGPAPGPERHPRSTLKIKCAFSRCTTGKDVKNTSSSLSLPIADVELDQCRRLRKDVQMVRFCCRTHLARCRARCAEAARKRGGREPLDGAQIQYMFTLFCNDSVPWTAVLFLLQTLTGERADAMRQARMSWLQGLEPDGTAAPSIAIPKVNKKTTPRVVPILAPVARALCMWIHEQPLQGSGGTQWPFEDQPLGDADAFLFPGCNGNKRAWERPVTERAYLKRFHYASVIIQRERAAHRRAQAEDPILPNHLFEDTDVAKIGTHTCKKSSVTMLAEAGECISIASALTGTSTRTLQSAYTVPTRKRQLRAMGSIFKDVTASLPTGSRRCDSQSQDHASASEASNPGIGFCVSCGKLRQRQWHFCPSCGHKFGSQGDC